MEHQEPWNMSLLEVAAATVAARRKVYDSPYAQHKIAADMFNSWKGTELTAADAAMFMMIIKISRLAKSPDHDDTVLDIAGYTDVYWECIKEQGVREPPTANLPATKQYTLGV